MIGGGRFMVYRLQIGVGALAPLGERRATAAATTAGPGLGTALLIAAVAAVAVLAKRAKTDGGGRGLVAGKDPHSWDSYNHGEVLRRARDLRDKLRALGKPESAELAVLVASIDSRDVYPEIALDRIDEIESMYDWSAEYARLDAQAAVTVKRKKATHRRPRSRRKKAA